MHIRTSFTYAEEDIFAILSKTESITNFGEEVSWQWKKHLGRSFKSKGQSEEAIRAWLRKERGVFFFSWFFRKVSVRRILFRFSWISFRKGHFISFLGFLRGNSSVNVLGVFFRKREYGKVLEGSD